MRRKLLVGRCTLGVVLLGSGCFPRGTALRVCARCLSTYRYTIAIHLHTRRLGPIVAVEEHSAVVLAREEISLLRRCAALVCSLASRPRTPSQRARILRRLEHVNMTALGLKNFTRGKPFRKSNQELLDRMPVAGEKRQSCRAQFWALSRWTRPVPWFGIASERPLCQSPCIPLPVSPMSADTADENSSLSCIHERDVCQHVIPSRALFGSWGGRGLDLRHVVALEKRHLTYVAWYSTQS
ncbi:hypothetical protein SVAN01_07275 [Stagonosporopsis vannaccii]|nr:hypothetical protein SVAN01_07275 [Stagonosporopsis vannaccii]